MIIDKSKAHQARILPPKNQMPSIDGGSANCIRMQPIWLMNPISQKIIDTCEANWDANKDDCNSFVIAVGTALDVNGLMPPADKIVDTITDASAGWQQLADGVAAKKAADDGLFVIGGLRSNEHNPPRTHGHVVVVVSGPLVHEKYPTGYWGSLGSKPYKNTGVNFAWASSDRDHVHYAAKRI